jgi:hypothetical protein
MTLRRRITLGTRKAGAQGALVAAGCPLGGVRPRTTRGAARCGPAAEVSFYSNELSPDPYPGGASNG